MKLSPMSLVKAVFTGKSNLSAMALRRLNIAFGGVLAVQAVALVLLSAAHKVPLTVSFLTTDTLQSNLVHAAVFAPATHQLAMVDLAYVLAAILIVSALCRAAAATFWRARYEAALKQSMWAWRWVEWSVVGGLMAVLLGLLAGMYDMASLLAVFVLVAGMFTAGFGLEMQGRASKRQSPLGTLWAGLGIAAGAGALLVVGLYMCATNIFGSAHVPIHLYWPYLVVVVLFAKLVTNTHLTLIKKGKWSSYIYGESWFMVLGFVGETVLAWLVFATVLHP